MDLERLLVQEGVAAPPEQIRAVLERAASEARDPVVALADAGVVVEDVLAEVLARAAGTVVVDLDRPLPDEHVTNVLAAGVARRHLALPVARLAETKLRVAFANPLSSVARDAAEAASGMTVQPLVATVSGLRSAIEKAYPGRTTRVLAAAKSEMPSENTRRLLTPLSEIPSTDTAPLHRLQARATAEQRHEALLLALIEKGVLTQADYMTALERLLSDRRESSD